jgi:hypothetical protein
VFVAVVKFGAAFGALMPMLVLLPSLIAELQLGELGACFAILFAIVFVVFGLIGLWWFWLGAGIVMSIVGAVGSALLFIVGVCLCWVMKATRIAKGYESAIVTLCLAVLVATGLYLTFGQFFLENPIFKKALLTPPVLVIVCGLLHGGMCGAAIAESLSE